MAKHTHATPTTDPVAEEKTAPAESPKSQAKPTPLEAALALVAELAADAKAKKDAVKPLLAASQKAEADCGVAEHKLKNAEDELLKLAKAG